MSPIEHLVSTFRNPLRKSRPGRPFAHPIEVRAEAKRLLKSGMSQQHVADKLGMSRSNVAEILRREKAGRGYLDETG